MQRTVFWWCSCSSTRTNTNSQPHLTVPSGNPEYQLVQTKTLHDPMVRNILLQESQQTGLSVFLDQDYRIRSKMNVYEEPIREELDAILAELN